VAFTLKLGVVRSKPASSSKVSKSNGRAGWAGPSLSRSIDDLVDPFLEYEILGGIA
jgi:hypothetical protein